MTRERPDVAPPSQPASARVLHLQAANIAPMYREIIPVDLPTVMRVAAAQNLDIRSAMQRVEAARGRYESTQGALFPVLAPGTNFEHVDGTVRATQGNLVGVGFDSLQVNAALQAVLNPGRVIYEVIAARKRLSASENDEQAVVLEALRMAATQYYDLVLARARLAAARQAVSEALELVRIHALRARTGVGVRADELRAAAELAARQQEVVLELNSYYNASIALAVTLHLDSSVTLAPATDEIAAITLLRDDFSLDELLGLAMQHRPDLAGARVLIAAARADRKVAWWAALGAQFQVGYQYGGITGHADRVVPGMGTPNNLILNPFTKNGAFSDNVFVNGLIKQQLFESSQRRAGSFDRTYTLSDQERFNAAATWRFSLSAVGDLKTAAAAERSAALESDRRMDLVRAEVAGAWQASRTQSELIPHARRQADAANEALRLSRENLRAGTMTTLDVLQAEDALAKARVRLAAAIVGYSQSQINLLAATGLLI